MAEYIEREAAIKIQCMDFGNYGFCDNDCSSVESIKRVPTADVRSVVRGRWERMSDNDVFGDINCKCSACGEDWWQGPGWFREANYCPNCGAMMEES